jgi:hypothetical protein
LYFHCFCFFCFFCCLPSFCSCSSHLPSLRHAQLGS